MQKRGVRLALITLLLATGLAAATFTWDSYHRIYEAIAAERDVDARFDRLIAAVAALGAAQQAYVAPGQPRGDALTQTSTRVQQLYEEAAALRRLVHSSQGAPALLAFGEMVDAIVKVDDRVREHLRDGQELMAADLVYTESRQAIETMTAQLRDLQAAELRASADEPRARAARGSMVLGGVALLWVAGLLALGRPPKAGAVTIVSTVTDTSSASDSDAPAPAPPVDLAAAAAVCTELTRLSSASDLPPVLAHAARVLDASGMVVWLGAGEELFATTAHGYSSKILSRLPPIPRGADNATAAAWRSGELCIVPAGTSATGAIVAPLFGPDGCFGVLAAEVRSGRELDATARAVSAMIAAQLSAIVAPWPAPSRGGESQPSSDESQADAPPRAQASA